MTLLTTVPRHIFAVLVALFAAGTASAQSASQQRADSLLRAARATAKAGDTAQAIKLLERATKSDEKNAEAHYLHGVFMSRTTSMGFKDLWRRNSAVASLQKAIDLDTKNAWAFLELGMLRLKMPGMRIAAEQSFQKALAVAITSKDPAAIAQINYEIGQIYDRRYRTSADRRMIVGDAQVLNPLEVLYTPGYVETFLKENALALPESGEIDAARAEVYYRESLKAKPGHEDASVGLAAILYAHQRYAEMAAVAREAVNADSTGARSHMALGLALIKLHDNSRANAILEQAVALLSDRERRIVASLSPIVRPNEAKDYNKLDGPSREAFDRQYWLFNDPLYMTTLNEQRLAYMGRVAYADLFFTTPPDPVVRGALTDRGGIVLRYGEPPVIATFPPDVQFKNNGQSLAKVTTLWWYPESGLKFVFIGPPAMSTALFAEDYAAYAKDLAASVPVRYEHLADELKIDTIPLQIARFRGDNPWNTRVEVHAAVPTNKLAAASGVVAMPIETGFMIFDQMRNMLVDAHDTVKVRTDDTQGRLRSWDRQFRPGEYGYSVEALEPQANRAARARGALQIVAFPAATFALSDVLVGTNLINAGEDLRRRADLKMKVLPDVTLDPGQQLGLFWESYGAKPSRDGAVRMRIEIALTVLAVDRAPVLHIRALGAIADKLGVSAEGERKVSLSYERTVAAPSAADDRVLHAIAVEMTGAPPAEYLLEITVTDLETGKTARTSHALHLRRSQ